MKVSTSLFALLCFDLATGRDVADPETPDSPLSVSKGGAHKKKKSKRAYAEDTLTKSLLNCPLCAGSVPCIMDCKYQGKTWIKCINFCMKDNPMIRDTFVAMAKSLGGDEEEEEDEKDEGGAAGAKTGNVNIVDVPPPSGTEDYGEAFKGMEGYGQETPDDEDSHHDIIEKKIAKSDVIDNKIDHHDLIEMKIAKSDVIDQKLEKLKQKIGEVRVEESDDPIEFDPVKFEATQGVDHIDIATIMEEDHDEIGRVTTEAGVTAEDAGLDAIPEDPAAVDAVLLDNSDAVPQEKYAVPQEKDDTDRHDDTDHFDFFNPVVKEKIVRLDCDHEGRQCKDQAEDGGKSGLLVREEL